MARLDSGKSWNVYLPNRRWEISRITFRLVTLFPSEKTGFMLPHIERVSQHRLVFDPDDLLVHQNATIAHCLFDLYLALRGVPYVDRGICLADGESLPKERFIEGAKRLALLLIGVASFPVLIFPVREILRGMVLRVVGPRYGGSVAQSFASLPSIRAATSEPFALLPHIRRCSPIFQIWPRLVFHFFCSSAAWSSFASGAPLVTAKS